MKDILEIKGFYGGTEIKRRCLGSRYV